MNPISCHFRHIILLSVAALPSMALAQPPEVAPPNTTVEVPQPQRAPKAADAALPVVTWDELSAQIGGPTLVTLHTEKMPVLQIIEELKRQTPVPLRIYPTELWKRFDDKLFSANYDAQPFWSVMRDFARQARIGISYSGDSVQFLPFTPTSGALSAVSGPCIFDLSQVEHLLALGQGGLEQGAAETLFLKGRLFVDPKVHWPGSYHSLYMRIDEAIDEDDQSLRLENEADNTQGLKLRGHAADLNIALKPPAKRADGTRAERVKRLRGSVSGLVAAQTQTWEVPDVLNAKNTEKTFGEGDVAVRREVQEVTKDGDNYRVVLVMSPGNGDLRSMLNFLKLSTGQQIGIGTDSYQDFQLLDAQGRALNKIKTDLQRAGDAQTVIYTFTSTFSPLQSDDENQRTGPPAKLVWNYDFDYRELVVPFEFKDIPLP